MVTKAKAKKSVKMSILYFDLQGSGKWRELSPAEKSEVEEHCQNYFETAANKFKCDHYQPNACRGDDAIAFFRDEDDCVNAGIKFHNDTPVLIRRTPHLEHVHINPRIIAFSALISGTRQGTYSARSIENILPWERWYGKAGTLRIVGDLLWAEISADIKKHFNKLPKPIKGKQGDPENIYEYLVVHDCEEIRSRHVPPYLPEYQQKLYKFYSKNHTARNSITEALSLQLKNSGQYFNKEQFTQVVLNGCRAYLESTVFEGNNTAKEWKFKLSYWTKNDRNKLYIFSYSYPDGLSCICHDKKIELNIGEGIVGQCWIQKEPIIQSTSSHDYKPLHDKRDKKIIAVAAFPIFEPISDTVIGVVSIDTKISGYFSNKPEEKDFTRLLLASFTKNLTLAEYFRD